MALGYLVAGIRPKMVYRTAIQKEHIHVSHEKIKIKDVQQNENIIHEAHDYIDV